VKDATACTIVLTAATGFRGFNKIPDTDLQAVKSRAIRDLDVAVKRSYGDLLRRHTNDYRAFRSGFARSVRRRRCAVANRREAQAV
jgi:alpha-L-fucosidase 2